MISWEALVLVLVLVLGQRFVDTGRIPKGDHPVLPQRLPRSRAGNPVFFILFVSYWVTCR